MHTRAQFGGQRLQRRFARARQAHDRARAMQGPRDGSPMPLMRR